MFLSKNPSIYTQDAFDWGQVDMSALAKCLLALCRRIKDVLKEEPRLLKLKSPTYILGETKTKLQNKILNLYIAYIMLDLIQIYEQNNICYKICSDPVGIGTGKMSYS